MKEQYDFSKGKRGCVIPEPPIEKGKVKITVRLDEDLIDQFGAMADAAERTGRLPNPYQPGIA